MACAGESGTSGEAGERLIEERDSAGVRIISNPATGRWSDSKAWTVERTLSIGAASGASEYLFGHLVDADVVPSGEIYLVDQQAGRVSVFDEGGSFLFNVGRPGSGPGEFSNNIPRGVQGVFVRADGSLFIPDIQNDRGNVFSPDGTFLGSFRLMTGADQRVYSAAVLPEDGFVVHHGSAAGDRLRHIRDSGEMGDTLLEFPPVQAGSASMPAGRVEALRHEPLWTVAPDGRLLSGRSDRFRIEVRDPEGELELVVLKQEEDAPLSESEEEQFLARLLDLWGEMFRSRGESEEWIRSQLRQGQDLYVLPERLPVFTGLAVGPEETIWVRRARPVDEFSSEILSGDPLAAFASNEWEIHSREGRYLGLLPLPPRFELFKVRGWSILGRERDSLGVQRFVRLRIIPDGADGEQR